MRFTDSLSKLLMFVLFLFLVSKVSVGQESESFIIKLDGTKIELHDDVKLDPTMVYYKNSNGKNKTIQHKHIKAMLIYNRLFVNLKLYGALDRLHEVIAFNSDYIMTGYWHDHLYVYVWDKDFNPIEKKIKFISGSKRYVNRNQEVLAQHVHPYFENCPALMEEFEKNIISQSQINSGISYYNCDSSINPAEIYMNLNK